MPRKKTPELPKGSTECILVTGKFNNIVQWRDEMQTAVSMLYGLTGTFFTKNIRYDDTAIDKMVKSVNRIIQSDKMVD